MKWNYFLRDDYYLKFYQHPVSMYGSPTKPINQKPSSQLDPDLKKRGTGGHQH